MASSKLHLILPTIFHKRVHQFPSLNRVVYATPHLRNSQVLLGGRLTLSLTALIKQIFSDCWL